MSKDGFGRWLRIMRIRNGMNQKDLAKELDIDQTTVSRLERGAQGMSGPLAAAVARVFNVAVDEVWSIAEEPDGKTFGESGDVYITPPPAMIGTGTTSPSVSAALSRESTEVARRLDQLPTPERARALRYFRAILTQAENEAPAPVIEDQPKDAP